MGVSAICNLKCPPPDFLNWLVALSSLRSPTRNSRFAPCPLHPASFLVANPILCFQPLFFFHLIKWQFHFPSCSGPNLGVLTDMILSSILHLKSLTNPIGSYFGKNSQNLSTSYYLLDYHHDLSYHFLSPGSW